MKVKMLTRLCGPRYNAEPGQTLNVDDATARDLIEGRYALAVDSPRPATKPEPEPVETTPEATSEPEPEPESKSQFVTDLALDEDVIDMLADAGIETADDIRGFGDLTKIQGIGKVTAKKILEGVGKEGDA